MASTSAKSIPKGYKQTEIGAIPSDWNVRTLSEIGTFKKGKNIKKDSVLIEGIPCIRYGEIYTHHDEYVKRFYSFINEETARQSQSIKAGDLLFAGSGETAEEIGKCVAYLDAVEAYAGGDIIILSPDDYDSKYLGFLMNYKIVVAQKSQLGQGDAVVHIYSSSLGKISIPIPPTKTEQTAIATVLSDTDALIEGLEKIIAKKRAIKKGGMQELLTGKRRLPRFKGKWELKRLGDFAEIIKGQGLSKGKLNESGKHYCILYGELFTTYGENIVNVQSKTNANEGIPSKYGDVLLPGSTTTKGIDLAKAAALQIHGVLLGGDINIIRQMNNTYNPTFLAYCLTYIYKNDIAQLTKGTTIHHLHAKDLYDLEIIMPKHNEQTAIIHVLSDMDLEIENLNSKLLKYQQIKQGMMHVLLAGKVRLV